MFATCENFVPHFDTFAIFTSMSGHSKWAQIKRQKGVLDIKRGQTFTKLANAITIAVREGGGDNPESNFRLRLAIEKARAFNMPKENVQRAIERGKGGTGRGASLEQIVYEGFGPGRVGIVVEAASDNRQRTTAEVKNYFEKNGGSLATPGAVSYQFETVGQISVRKNGKSVDEIFLTAADAGALDVEEAGEEVLIYTKPEELTIVRNKIAPLLSVVAFELVRLPTVTVPIGDRETSEKVLTFIEKLEELPDVQRVFANFDIEDQFLPSPS